MADEDFVPQDISEDTDDEEDPDNEIFYDEDDAPSLEDKASEDEEEPVEDLSEDEDDDEDDDDDEEEEDEPEEEKGEEKKEPEEKAEKKDEDPILKEKVKLKVNDREIEKTVGELVKDAQLGISAHEKFQAAAAAAKKANAVIEAVKSDPLSTAYKILAEEHGGEAAYTMILRQATELVREHMEYEALPEKERLALDKERQARERLEEAERLEREAQERIRAQRQRELAEGITQACIAAGEVKLQGGKATLAERKILSEVAKIYDMAAEAQQPISFEEAVEQFKALQRKEVESYLASTALSLDELERLNPALVKAIAEAKREERIRKAKESRAPRRPSTDQAKAPARRPKKPRFFDSFEQAFEDARRR